jgi:hypothetical protein
VYLLGEDRPGRPRFEAMRPAAALLELVQNSFLLDPDAPQTLEAQHALLSAVVSRVPVFKLHYPRQYDGLAQVCTDLVDHARRTQAIS